MDSVYTHIRSLWPVFLAGGALVVALLIAVRYKLPDLTRRMDLVEEKGVETTDLETAIDGFRTVCQFNQVTCQKEMQHNWSLLQKEFDEKLSLIHEKMNSIALTNATLITKIDILLAEKTGNNNHLNGG